MELTTTQIKEIEQYLDAKNIVYIDLRPEILDHIISDIEEKILAEEVTFYHAFGSVKQKWNAQLEETTSMFFGLGFSAPKIVIQKAKKLYWKQYILLLASYFLPFLVLTHFDFKFENPDNFTFFMVTKYMVGASLFGFFYMLIFNNYKVKTTYGFILKSQSLGVLTGLLVFVIIINSLKELNGIHVGMICSYLFVTYSYYTFFKKHKEEIAKYKIA